MDRREVSRPSASIDERQVGLRTNYANRERLLDTDTGGAPIGVPNIPLLAIRGWLCIRCLAHKPDLKACGACKRVRYCSERCQIVDWKCLHKTHCEMFRHINSLEAETTADAGSRSWGQLSNWLNLHMNILAQGIDKIASSIFGSQPYCNTCYRSEYKLRVIDKVLLESCENCHVAFKCQECQAWNHSDQTCEFYQLFSSEEFFAIDHFNETGDVVTNSPVPVPSNSFTEMALLGGWFDYFKELHGRQEIAAFVEPKNFGFAPSRMPEMPGRSRKEIEKIALNYWAGLRAPTGAGSISMTIANALYVGLPDLRERTSLLIHIVGAGSREYGVMMMFEEILHLFPNLRTLRTVLVGPQTPTNTGPDGKGESHGFVEHDCCPRCTKQGRQRFVAMYRGKYHDFAKIEQYAKPDLAVLFHSGRTQCEVGSWAPTIRYLVDQDIVTACTTYTMREAVEEVVQLNKDFGATIIRRFEENKWKSLVPLLEIGDGAEHSVYHGDYYWYLFRGKA